MLFDTQIAPVMIRTVPPIASGRCTRCAWFINPSSMPIEMSGNAAIIPRTIVAKPEGKVMASLLFLKGVEGGSNMTLGRRAEPNFLDPSYRDNKELKQ